ncbi:hypothetical protein ACSQ67_025983 [Phaseolus vulgaris]
MFAWQRGEARGGDSDEGSEEKFGEELLELEGSDADVQQYEGERRRRVLGEILGGGRGGARGWRRPLVESERETGLILSMRRCEKEDGTSKGLPTNSRSGNAFDLIVSGPTKAQLHKGSEFSIFEGLGSKQLEDEQTGGVPIPRSARIGVEGAVEARVSDDYHEEHDDNPRECNHGSLSMVEASGGDLFAE